MEDLMISKRVNEEEEEKQSLRSFSEQPPQQIQSPSIDQQWMMKGEPHRKRKTIVLWILMFLTFSLFHFTFDRHLGSIHSHNLFSPKGSNRSFMSNFFKKQLPTNSKERALALMEKYPVIDGHVDLPILVRAFFANQISEVNLDGPVRGQVDIPRLREGKVGGFFWSVYIPCPEDAGYPIDNMGNFTTSTWRVRDTLEQIDVSRLLIEQHSDTFTLVSNANEWRTAIKTGKIGAMIGVEGGHQLGNTLSSLRMYYQLGARYVTLTHTCHNALADSCGMQGTKIEERWGGLSPFGRTAIREMNRLGMIIDLSHTSPETASEALTLSLAPPIFSHSNARGVHDVVRNVPDAILRRIGATSKYHGSKGQKGKCPSRKQNGKQQQQQQHKGRATESSESITGSSTSTFDLSSSPPKTTLHRELQGWGADTAESEKPIPSGDSIIMLNFSPDFISEWGNEGGLRANISLLADHADYIGLLAGRDHVGIGSDLDGIAKTPLGLEDASKYPDLVAELIRRGWSDSEIAGFTSGNILRILDKVEAVSRELNRAPPETEIFSGRTDMHRRDHY